MCKRATFTISGFIPDPLRHYETIAQNSPKQPQNEMALGNST